MQLMHHHQTGCPFRRPTNSCLVKTFNWYSISTLKNSAKSIQDFQSYTAHTHERIKERTVVIV